MEAFQFQKKKHFKQALEQSKVAADNGKSLFRERKSTILFEGWGTGMAPDLKKQLPQDITGKPTAFFLALQWMEKNMSELFSAIMHYDHTAWDAHLYTNGNSSALKYSVVGQNTGKAEHLRGLPSWCKCLEPGSAELLWMLWNKTATKAAPAMSDHQKYANHLVLRGKNK